MDYLIIFCVLPSLSRYTCSVCSFNCTTDKLCVYAWRRQCKDSLSLWNKWKRKHLPCMFQAKKYALLFLYQNRSVYITKITGPFGAICYSKMEDRVYIDREFVKCCRIEGWYICHIFNGILQRVGKCKGNSVVPCRFYSIRLPFFSATLCTVICHSLTVLQFTQQYQESHF